MPNRGSYLTSATSPQEWRYWGEITESFADGENITADFTAPYYCWVDGLINSYTYYLDDFVIEPNGALTQINTSTVTSNIVACDAAASVSEPVTEEDIGNRRPHSSGKNLVSS